MQFVNVPIFSLIESDCCANNSVYDEGFDDYLVYPVIEKQLHFRIQPYQGKFISHSFDSLPEAGQQTSGEKNLTHLKLAEQCADYLLANLGDSHTLSKISCTLGTNRNSLAIAFKAIYGKGVFCWLKEQRLNKARELLCTTDASIQSIAYQVGFSDAANFSRTYKKEFDLSPGQTRKLLILTKTED